MYCMPQIHYTPRARFVIASLQWTMKLMKKDVARTFKKIKNQIASFHQDSIFYKITKR